VSNKRTSTCPTPVEYKKIVHAKNIEVENCKNMKEHENLNHEKPDVVCDHDLSDTGHLSKHFLNGKLKEENRLYWWKEELNENDQNLKNLENEKNFENLKNLKNLKKNLKYLSEENNFLVNKDPSFRIGQKEKVNQCIDDWKKDNNIDTESVRDEKSVGGDDNSVSEIFNEVYICIYECMYVYMYVC
jgi:hypothetical protein